MTWEMWVMEGWQGKLCIVAIAGIFMTSTVRVVRSAWRLYFYFGDIHLPERIASGEVPPVVLAGYALSNKVEPVAVGMGRPGRWLDSTQIEFAYLCERCAADIASLARASWIVLLLSLIMIAFRVMPALNDCNTRNAALCVLNTVMDLLARLQFGLSSCAFLFVSSSIFKRKLDKRRSNWTYLFNRLKHGA